MNRIALRRLGALLATAGVLGGCGGGGSDGAPAPVAVSEPSAAPAPGPSAAPPPGPAATNLQRSQAATTTAETDPQCTAIAPFYWEIGDADGALASGSVGGTYRADSRMSIASASKWLYSTYYVQRTRGALSASDIDFLDLRSGYTNFSSCLPTSTVGDCLALAGRAVGTNGDLEPGTVGKFDYGGGHMQVHAAQNGLGGLDNDALAAEIRSQIGSDVALAYSQPSPAGGGVTSAAEYAKVLRKILGGQLVMHDVLGTHPVCTQALECPGQALGSPAPPRENWHYSIGHWVEDADNASDGAFSSPGAFGFYPWIDRTKTYYGVVARVDATGALDSVYCGRLIRKAWTTANPQ